MCRKDVGKFKFKNVFGVRRFKIDWSYLVMEVVVIVYIGDR